MRLQARIRRQGCAGDLAVEILCPQLTELRPEAEALGRHDCRRTGSLDGDQTFAYAGVFVAPRALSLGRARVARLLYCLPSNCVSSAGKVPYPIDLTPTHEDPHY